MPLPFENDVQPETVGLALCKIVGKELRLAEGVLFTNGRAGVLTTLQRANLSGHVGGSIDETTSHWADQLDANGDIVGEIRLDRESWNMLKNRWMRCSMLRSKYPHPEPRPQEG